MQNVDIAELVRQALLILTLIIVAAKLGGELLARLGLPSVLGELLIGVLLGNLNIFGFTLLEPLKTSSMLGVVAELGAILLLFEVGVESDLLQLLKVGWSSLAVAALGVIVPMALGYLVSMRLIPEVGWLTHLFVGATLTATSVGITARVLKDLGRANTKEARIILGAAVADDVIGLIVMAVISGLVTAAVAGHGIASVGWGSALWVVAKAVLFLVVAVVAGRFWSQHIFTYVARLRVSGALLGVCVSFCFIVSALAGFAGLAPIVGAFAAGVVLEEAHYSQFVERGELRLEELLFPITTLIVPIFFVLMGLRVDLRSLASPGVISFAALITLVAIVGKQVCGLGVLDHGVDRLVIGVGMIPRGEVGLIFASLGSTLVLNHQPVLSKTTFSALVMMVMLTTFITPPFLKLAFDRKGKLPGVGPGGTPVEKATVTAG